MEENKIKSSQLHLLVGILFAIVAVSSLRNLILSFSLLNLLASAGYLLISAMLLIQQKDITLSIGFFMVAFCDFVCFIVYSGFVNRFVSILSVAAYVFLGLMSLAAYTNLLPKYKNNIYKIYFIPIILIAVSIFLSFISTLIIHASSSLRILIYGAAEVAAVVITCRMIGFIYGVPEKTIPIRYDTEDQTASSVLPKEAFCDMVKHVLLLLFTFGIWNLIWIYKVTGYLNVVKDEEARNPTTKLLLCMFIPFYHIYWTYKSAQRVDKLAKQAGFSSDIATLCLIMSIFLPIISPIIMQDKMNSILTKKPTAAYPQAEVNIGAANELKNFKDLLDSGVITQEEFEAKKKQLLGL